MKRALGFSVMLMLGCATGVAMRDLVVPARAQNQVGPTYEYSTVELKEYDKSDIDHATTQFAKEGWRLASTIQRSDIRGYLIFERQLAR
jgi:hypothetical protein